MKLKTLQDKVLASIRLTGIDVAPGGDMHKDTIEMIVVHAARALGLEVNQTTGDLYNPACEDDALFPQQRNVRYAGMGRRKR